MGLFTKWRENRAKKKFITEIREYLQALDEVARTSKRHSEIRQRLMELKDLCNRMGVQIPELEEKLSLASLNRGRFHSDDPLT